MKKTILSLAALLAVATVSAQSYGKQPDPSAYEVVYYKKAAPAQTEVKEQPEENKTGNSQAQPNSDRKIENTSGEVKATSAVAVNEEKSTAKKNQ